MFWVFFFFFGCKICGILAPNQTCTFCFGRPTFNHWTAREVPAVLFLLVFSFFFVYKFPKCFFWWVHLPLQLCTLLSAPGGWPVWTKVMGFHALWLGLANAYPVRRSENRRRRYGYISPSLSLQLPQAGCAGGIYSRSGADFPRPSFQAQGTPLCPNRKICCFQGPTAPCSPLSPTQFAICSCSLGK